MYLVSKIVCVYIFQEKNLFCFVEVRPDVLVVVASKQL